MYISDLDTYVHIVMSSLLVFIVACFQSRYSVTQFGHNWNNVGSTENKGPEISVGRIWATHEVPIEASIFLQAQWPDRMLPFRSQFCKLGISRWKIANGRENRIGECNVRIGEQFACGYCCMFLKQIECDTLRSQSVQFLTNGEQGTRDFNWQDLKYSQTYLWSFNLLSTSKTRSNASNLFRTLQAGNYKMEQCKWEGVMW